MSLCLSVYLCLTKLSDEYDEYMMISLLYFDDKPSGLLAYFLKGLL